MNQLPGLFLKRSFDGLIIQSPHVTVMLVPMPNSEVIKVSYTDQIQNVKQKFQRTKMPNFASHSGFKIVSKVLSRVTRLLSPG